MSWATSGFLRSERFGRCLIVGVGVAVVALFCQQQMLLTGELDGFPLDDAYIHLQFAENLAASNGLAFVADRPVPGSTSPLWTALLSPAFLISPQAAVYWSKLLGVVLFLLAGLELAGLARDLGASRPFAMLAGVLLVMTETLAFSALSGMEVPLFVLITLRGMRCVARENAASGGDHGSLSLVSPGVWLLLVSALARPEGLMLAGLVVIERLWLRSGGVAARRSMVPWLASGAALAAIVLLPVAALFFTWSGSPLPTTFSVKAGIGHQWWPSTRDLWRFGEVLFRVQPMMTVLAAAGAVACIRRASTALPVVWLAGLPLAYSVLNAPGQLVLLGNFGRYAFPLLPAAVVLGCLGLDELFRALNARGGNRRVAACLTAIAVAIAVYSPLTAVFNGAGRSALAVQNVEQSDVAAATWIKTHLPQERVAAQDIGALAFVGDVDLVDLVGLVNPEILPYTRGPLRGSHPSGLEGMFDFVKSNGIDYLLLFPRSYGGMENLSSVQPGLELVQRFRLERNVAMAASELVLLRFPDDRDQP